MDVAPWAINGMGSLISLTLEEQYSLLIFEVWQIFQCIFGVFWGLFFKPCFEKVKKTSKFVGPGLPYKNTSDIFTFIQEIWKRRRDEFHLSLALLPRYKLRASESMSVLRHFSFREETQFSRILQILKHWVGGERLASRRTFQVSTDHFSISAFQKICKKKQFCRKWGQPIFQQLNNTVRRAFLSTGWVEWGP